ncbi:MAG: FtsX-like permease family protein [Lachnospiraceae bacterium]|jgi:ABC-type antimicrobial peptide transport system permease subunit|nr:FtsX-like permease family protein [Lachnospiraceae bacterium]
MTLFRKALRSMWRNKKTYIACILLIGLGVMLYLAYGVAGESLYRAKDVYYRDADIADAFASVKSISASQVAAFRLDGIEEVSARLVYDSRVDADTLPDGGETDQIIKLRLMTQAQSLNRITLSAGSVPALPEDILMGQGFLDAHGLEIGDEVGIIVKNRRVMFRICGVFMTPEYVYIIDDGGSLMPDEGTFNLSVVLEETLQGLLGMPGAYNDLSFRFGEAVTMADIRADLEAALEPYGLVSLTALEDQLSNAMLTTEIDSIVSMGESVPMAFILISIALLYLMLKRMIEQDRSQVGMLKAFGYTNLQILGHYASYGAATGFMGALLGATLGYALTGAMLDLYNVYFKMPNLVPAGVWPYILRGIMIAVLGGGAGAVMGAAGVLGLRPADSMRPAAPKYRKRPARRGSAAAKRSASSPSLPGDDASMIQGAGAPAISGTEAPAMSAGGEIPVFGKRSVGGAGAATPGIGASAAAVPGGWQGLRGFAGGPRRRMAARSISRNKVRSAFVVGGLMFAFAILAFMGSYSTMIDDMMLVQYSRAQVYDGRLNFLSPVDAHVAVTETARVRGVADAQPLLEAPLRLHAGHRNVDVTVTGIDADCTLYYLYDTERHVSVMAPADGIVLSKKTAQDLEVGAGDVVTVEDTQLVVREVVATSFGAGAFMERRALGGLTGWGDVATSAMVRADDLTELKELAKVAANVRNFEDQAYTRKLLTDMMAPYASLGYVFLAVGILVAFAIAYNTSSITMMERKREYSTLRVLGFHVGEVAGLLGFEYWILGIVGMLFGIPLAKFFKLAVAGMVEMDQFSMPTGLGARDIAVAIACTCIAILWSNAAARGQVRKMDMVEVLKERE